MPSGDVAARPSIALVVPWFGPLPTTFDPWLRSCAGNPTIDWLLFTDEDLTGHVLPANVHHVEVDFAGVRELFSGRLGMELCLERPYQLCNFKIAYGWLFKEWLADYEIWGYCDIDVVWGDLRSFFPADMLRKYPKVQQNGHLTFYHNTAAVNELFRQAHPRFDYRVVFTHPEVTGFDEWRGAHELAYLAGLDQHWMQRLLDVDSDVYPIQGYGIHNYAHQLFYWEDGALYREYIANPGSGIEKEHNPVYQIDRDEFAYMHLFRRHMRAPDFDAATARGFYITPEGFVQKLKAEHCLEDFSLLNAARCPNDAGRRGVHANGQAVRRLVLKGMRTTAARCRARLTGRFPSVQPAEPLDLGGTWHGSDATEPPREGTLEVELTDLDAELLSAEPDAPQPEPSRL